MVCHRVNQILLATALLCFIGPSVANGGVVDSVMKGGLQGVTVLHEGPEYENFARPLPEVVETTIFKNFQDMFSQTQEFHANGQNTYIADGRQFVASISSGRVTGVLGNIYDAQGREFSEFTPAGSRLADMETLLTKTKCKQFKRLAVAIQKYGHMYYHFMQEVLPRIILMLPYTDSDTKVLTFGSAHEYKWLAELGISADQIEVYDPAVQYCADELLVAPMSPIVTPPKENYELLRKTFGAEAPLPAKDRDLVIYCTRQRATDRHVANEPAILAAIQKQISPATLYVFTGAESVKETVKLFRQAKVVIGMHGAGLSHSIFSALDVAVVEFLFMTDPPMMFWHATSALNQRYVMVPVAQTWWLDPQVTVPVQDVIDALSIALDVDQGPCEPGFFMYEATGSCLACPAGTYRPAGASSCLPCAAGRAASKQGSAFCTTCPGGTYSDSGFECPRCLAGMGTMFPGAGSAKLCIPEKETTAAFDKLFDDNVLMQKLVALPALEQPVKKSHHGYVSSGSSSGRQLQDWHQKEMRQRYLKELFKSESLRGTTRHLETASGLSHQRHLHQYGRRLSQYGRRR